MKLEAIIAAVTIAGFGATGAGYHYTQVVPIQEAAQDNTCERVWNNYLWAKRRLRDAQADYAIAKTMARSDPGASFKQQQERMIIADKHARAMYSIAMRKCPGRQIG